MLKYLQDNLFNSLRNQLILILVLTAAVYLNSLSNRLVWDDHLFLENWNAITSYNNVGEILKGSAPPSQDKIFRPVRGLIWLVDYQTFGANPFFYHLQALLIHLGTTFFVYLIAFKILKRVQDDRSGLRVGQVSMPAFLTALFFGIHPIHTETIDYISASVETFGSLFFFISFYLYLYYSDLPKKVKNYLREITLAGSVLFAALAFFTYEMTLVLPVLILIYEFVVQKTKFGLKSFGNRIYPFSGIAVSAAVYLFVRLIILQIGSRTEYLAYSFYHTKLVMVQVFIRYVFLMLFPWNQTAIHNLVGEFPSSMIPYDRLDPVLNLTVFDTPVLLSILGIGALLALAIRYREDFPVPAFGVLWFFVSLLPVSYIIPHGGAMAEKYLYIASFGFILSVVYMGIIGYFNIAERVKGQKSKVKQLETVFLGGVIVLTAIFSVLTFQRNMVWKDDISLFTDVVKKSPGNLMANYTLGIWYGKYNYFEEAEYYYGKALEKAPEFWEARYNLGNLYLKQAKFDEAENEYSGIVKAYPEHTPAKNILANIDLIKESTPSMTPDGDLLVKFEKRPEFEFNFPLNWSLEDDSEKIILKDPGQVFSVEIAEDSLNSGKLTDKKEVIDKYLGTQVESTTSGTLINQGLAQVPNVEQANVKVYQLEDKVRLQFYLFGGDKVIKVSAFPADQAFMGQFDLILGSIVISNQ